MIAFSEAFAAATARRGGLPSPCACCAARGSLSAARSSRLGDSPTGIALLLSRGWPGCSAAPCQPRRLARRWASPSASSRHYCRWHLLRTERLRRNVDRGVAGTATCRCARRGGRHDRRRRAIADPALRVCRGRGGGLAFAAQRAVTKKFAGADRASGRVAGPDETRRMADAPGCAACLQRDSAVRLRVRTTFLASWLTRLALRAARRRCDGGARWSTAQRRRVQAALTFSRSDWLALTATTLLAGCARAGKEASHERQLPPSMICVSPIVGDLEVLRGISPRLNPANTAPCWAQRLGQDHAAAGSCGGCSPSMERSRSAASRSSARRCATCATDRISARAR